METRNELSKLISQAVAAQQPSLGVDVLFVGLAVALAALDNLFGLDVPAETYVRCWIALWFVVNTWVFLGGVPDDLPSLQHQTDYPTGLKVFAQYVLVPCKDAGLFGRGPRRFLNEASRVNI